MTEPTRGTINKNVLKAVDDNGVEYTIDDFRCDDEPILQDGECVCGAFDCPTEYACHTSGY